MAEKTKVTIEWIEPSKENDGVGGYRICLWECRAIFSRTESGEVIDTLDDYLMRDDDLVNAVCRQARETGKAEFEI